MQQTIIYSNLIFLTLFFVACSHTTVGGNRTYGKGNILEHRIDNCEGSCIQFSENGKCVEFSRGISEVCIDYFNNLEK